MHDDTIVEYTVDLEGRKLIIHTYNEYEKRKGKIYFSEVLTHSFKCILEWNQILDIYESELSDFVKDNQQEIKEQAGYCWPTRFIKTEQELVPYLKDNGYKYVIIQSSYGLCGWVLAKSYYFEE